MKRPTNHLTTAALFIIAAALVALALTTWSQRQQEAEAKADEAARIELRMILDNITERGRNPIDDRAINATILEGQEIELRAWQRSHAGHGYCAIAAEMAADAHRLAELLRSDRDAAFCSQCLQGHAAKAERMRPFFGIADLKR
jgi:hypothetical protein